jgi:hypothetical protein
MKFDPILLKIFKRRSIADCKDKQLIDDINALGTNVPDPIYFTFHDTSDILIKELVHHNKRKTFFKQLLKETLRMEDIAPLGSMLTHLSISMVYRCEVRKDVNIEFYSFLRTKINELIDSLLKDEVIYNPFYNQIKLILDEKTEVSSRD